MKSAGYIVTKGGRPCGLLHVPLLKGEVLVVGEPVAFFDDLGALDPILRRTMTKVSQLRGTKLAESAREKKRAAADARLFVVVPLRRSGGRTE